MKSLFSLLGLFLLLCPRIVHSLFIPQAFPIEHHVWTSFVFPLKDASESSNIYLILIVSSIVRMRFPSDSWEAGIFSYLLYSSDILAVHYEIPYAFSRNWCSSSQTEPLVLILTQSEITWVTQGFFLRLVLRSLSSRLGNRFQFHSLFNSLHFAVKFRDDLTSVWLWETLFASSSLCVEIIVGETNRMVNRETLAKNERTF